MVTSEGVLWPLYRDANSAEDDAEAIAEALERGILPGLLAFGEQRAAIECNARLVALLCSGRAGKTRGALLKWLQVCARKPGQISLYTGLSIPAAKRIAWNQIRRLDKELQIGLDIREGDHKVVHPNGSELILLGANRDDLIDMLRGFPIVLVIFDEAAFYRGDLLRRAYEDAVSIRLLDYDGECWIISTPGYVPSGFHYDIVKRKKPGWAVFRWNYFDNPHLPEGRPDLDTDEKRREYRVQYALQKRLDNGWTETTPSYVREFLGDYADDPDARVYKFDRKRNLVPSMPESWTTNRAAWTTILGIDYGSTNAFAMVLWAWEKGSKVVYGVRAQKWYGKAPSECADLTNAWRNDPELGGIDRIIGDSAAKGYIDEARIRHQIPIQGADKLNKRGHVEHMNDSWLSARILLVGTLAFPEDADDTDPFAATIEGPCAEYADEMEKLGWNPKFEKGHPSYRMKEDPNAENDAGDAGLYAWVESPAFAEKALPPPPAPNPAAGTAFEQQYERIVKPAPQVAHPGLRGAFGAGRFVRRRR